MEELTPSQNPRSVSAVRRQMLRDIFRETLEATDVRAAFARAVSCEQGLLRIAGLRYQIADFSRLIVIAIGKAAVPSAAVMLDTLAKCGTRIDAIVVGPGDLLNSPYPVKQWKGSHPLPDASARDAAQHILATLRGTTADDLILFLISGGASAMVELPLDPSLTTEEIAGFYRALVHSGLNIAEMNTLRKHLSATKGGRLAEAASDATKCTVLISDVREGMEDVIGSGPSLPDSSTREQCFDLMRSTGLQGRVPARVRTFLESPDLPETPKPGSSCFASAKAHVVLSTETMLLAAANACNRRGFHVVINNACDDWPYDEAADYLLDRLRELSAEYPRVALLSGGEVLVSVSEDPGVGGRNQQFALYCAAKLHAIGAETAVLSAGTDGVDGNSPAAGAVADQTTLDRAGRERLQDALDRFDSYPLLTELGDTIVTGATGNNLRDLRILIAERNL